MIDRLISDLRATLPPLELTLEEGKAAALFARLQTQWTYSPAGGLVGISYDALQFVSQTLDIEVTGPVLRMFQTMENEVVKEVRERDRRSRAQRQTRRR